MPLAVRTSARKAYRHLRRAWLRPRWGNLCRSRPFSDYWTQDPGTPIDILCTADFIDANVETLTGRILEVGTSTWADRAETSRVTSVDVIDMDPDNPRATILADPCDPVALGPSSYDCVIMSRPLPCHGGPAGALSAFWTALEPGGTILLSWPVIHSTCDPRAHQWRLTASEMRALAEKTLPDARTSVCDRGSLAMAIAMMAGITVEQMPERALLWQDTRFPVVACARIDKPKGRN